MTSLVVQDGKTVFVQRKPIATAPEHKASSLGDLRICYLIPVYNDQNGLLQSLMSIFTDDPLAVVLVVDDGSLPACLLPKTPGGFEVELVRLDEHVGLVAALNVGLNWILEHRFTYIARLDAGDTVRPGRLQAQMEYLERHPEVGVVGTQMMAVDEATGRELYRTSNPVDPGEVMRTLKVRNCLPHPSAMIRVDVVRELGYYDSRVRYAEDYEMWRRIIRKCMASNLAEVYVHKAISARQMTAMYRAGFILSKLKIQFRYFQLRDPWCWLGIIRTLIALCIPRRLLLLGRTMLNT